MKIRFGKYKYGNCWRWWPLEINRYWDGKIIVISIWKFYIDFDFRKNWIEDMK